MSDVRTTCPYCGVGCGVLVSHKGEVRGDPAHPANAGRLCSKGQALGETLDDSRRLLRPRVHGRDTTWDEALDEVAHRFSETIAAHGPESVAFYVSGQLLTEDYYVANKLMKGFIGGANIDTNSRLCMASAVAGHVRAFGGDVVPVVYEDLEDADLVVIVGSNMAWCHPVLYQRLAAARETRGTRVVNIDPRRTATSEIADLHLGLAPGSDVMLFAGLLVYLQQKGHVNTAWVTAHTADFTTALKTAQETATTVEQVAHTTGLSVSDIITFYEWFAATERTVTAFSQGVNQSSAGTDKANAIINCHLATGRIGRPGMGPFSITGQPNAMGGREVGGFANQVAVHVGFDDPAEVARVGQFWSSPAMATKPGLKAIDMFEAVRDGRIKALWIMATNPVASLPRGNLIREALQNCPFVVVSDCWETDTTAFAHVTLPAAGWGEKDGTVTNSERRISRQRAFRPAPGEAKPDWWALTKVARRMGWVGAFPYRCTADIFREHAALSAHMNEGRRAFNIGGLAGLSDDEFDLMEPVRWPVTKSSSGEAGRMFAEGGFPTADGRARFVATAWRPPAHKTGREYPYILNTGRIRDQWHTMTRTGIVPRLMAHQDEPFLDIHADDAAKLGVEDGGLMRVETAHGAGVLRCRISDGQRKGEVFAPMHWTADFSSSGPTNRLVTAERDPISGQPELKATPARLAPVPTLWRGMLFTRDCSMPQGTFYAARVPGDDSQIFVLRGWNPLPVETEFAGWIEDLLGDGSGLRTEVHDQSRGIYRFAVTVGGVLESCLFLSKDVDGLPVEREKIAERLGQKIDQDSLTEILALPAAGQKKPSLGPIVCACLSVRAATIRNAITDDGLRTVAEIGAHLGAGTSCGSCQPELRRMLREQNLALA